MYKSTCTCTTLTTVTELLLKILNRHFTRVCVIANSLKLRKQIWNYEIKLSQQQLVKNMKFLFYIIKCSSFEKGIKKLIILSIKKKYKFIIHYTNFIACTWRY